MKKIKLSTKAVLSLGLSAVLFCMPAVGFALNGNYAVNVHAEDSGLMKIVRPVIRILSRFRTGRRGIYSG